MDFMTPKLPILETLMRATVVYLAVVACLRVVAKRLAGSISPQDLVAAVIVGGLAAEGIAKAEAEIPDILIMIVTVLSLNYLLDWIGDRFPSVRKFLRESPTRLIHNGQVIRKAIRSEMLTEEELLAQLRKQGVKEFKEVQEAFLEADGRVSVIKAK